MQHTQFQRHNIETQYSAFRVNAEVITGDYESDLSASRLTRRLPPYVNDLEVLVGDTDVTEMLNETTLDEIQADILRGNI